MKRATKRKQSLAQRKEQKKQTEKINSGGPRHLRWIPNAITTLRLVLLLPFCYLLATGQFVDAAIVYIIALITDFDGAIARRYKWTSKFGAIYDPTVDGIFLVLGSVLLLTAGKLSLLPLALYLVSALFRLVPSLVHLRVTKTVQTTRMSKATAFCGYGSLVLGALSTPLGITSFVLVVGAVLNVLITMRWMRRGHFVLERH
jgi:phosphatidylglycerophosphate synthase